MDRNAHTKQLKDETRHHVMLVFPKLTWGMRNCQKTSKQNSFLALISTRAEGLRESHVGCIPDVQGDPQVGGMAGAKVQRGGKEALVEQGVCSWPRGECKPSAGL